MKYNGLLRPWLDEAKRLGLICNTYLDMIEYAEDDKDLFYRLCDSNGITFIQELRLRDVRVPIDLAMEAFAPYLNGNTVNHYDTPHGSYTSKMYMRYKDSLTVDTSLVSLVECDCDVYVPENAWPTIVVGQDCVVRLSCMKEQRMTIRRFGNAKILTKYRNNG